MGVSFEKATENLDDAAKVVFEDPKARSIGIGFHEGAFGYYIVRNSAMILPQRGALGASTKKKKALPAKINDIPLIIRDTPQEVRPHLRVPLSDQTAAALTSSVIEQGVHRPLCIGLQIQNFDDDVREGVIARNQIIIGTLGCFVKLSNGKTALLSNNHVIAGENHGKKNQDRILQSGSGTFTAAQHIATLTNFTKINPSAPNATFVDGTAVLNLIDAGVAELRDGIKFDQAFHSARQIPKPTGVASPKVGDRVFKVGRTTGLTQGEIKSVATVVGPVPYKDGDSWFIRSITIEGLNGTMFSDNGDSGSVIVKNTGEIVGLLYAGNGEQTYACPIDEVFKKMKCTLI